MLGSGKWRPSIIEDQLLDILEEHAKGCDIYDETATDSIINFMAKYFPNITFKLGCSEWPNQNGGVCCISWIEPDDNYLGSLMFDYVKEGCFYE